MGRNRVATAAVKTFCAVTTLLAAAGYSANAAAADVLLADLDVKNGTQDWLTVSLVNTTEKGGVPQIGSVTFPDNAYVTNGQAILAIELLGKASRFSGSVGVDRDVLDDGTYTPDLGHVQFGIWDDRGTMIWQSDVLAPGQEPVSFDVPLDGVQRIYLLSDKTKDDFYFDHAVWGGGVFAVQDGATIRSIRLSPPVPTISMTAPGPSPKINSPQLIGVLPKTPFLHTIAATGTAPITFDAVGLPAGLTVDAATGQVSGSVAQAGSYDVKFKATNSVGTAERAVKIKVGPDLELTPAMGWNSYDAYGDSVTEAEVVANAQWLKDNLQPFGWEYVVTDFRWFDPKTSGAPVQMDAHGRLQPATNRFPDGFEGLSKTIHGLGLKFGFHILRGVPRAACTTKGLSGDFEMTIDGTTTLLHDACNVASTCSWDSNMYGAYSADVVGATSAQQAAGAAWYASLGTQFTAWEPDFIKADDMFQNDQSVPNLLYKGEVSFLLSALVTTNRSVLLSLSPGPQLKAEDSLVGSADFLLQKVHAWRIANDLWDDAQYLDTAFLRAAVWQNKGSVGHWPDADMLPLGYLGPRSPAPGIVRTHGAAGSRMTALTKNEQVSMMTLWSMMPSPLMLGASLADTRTTGDAWTRHLLTNDEVLAVDQDALGARGVRFDGAGIDPQHLYGIEAWVKDLADGTKAIAIFNRSLIYQRFVDLPWSSVNLSPAQNVRDLWQKADLGVMKGSLSATIAAHGAVLFKISPAAVTPGGGGAGGGGAGGAGPGGGQAGGAAGGATGDTGGTAVVDGGGASQAGSGANDHASSSSGCGCRTGSGSGQRSALYFLLTAAAVVGSRRRARKKP